MGLTGVSMKQEFFPGISDLVAGKVTAQPYSDQLPGEANEEFVTEYREHYDEKDPIPAVAATAYHAAQHIAAAVNEAGSKKPGDISEQMPEVAIDGVLGKSNFRAENHRFSADMHLFEINADGRYVPVKDFGVVEDTQEKTCS